MFAGWLSLRTLKVRRPFGRSILGALSLLVVVVVVLEMCLRSTWALYSLPAPTVGEDVRFPEIDIKFRRLEVMGRQAQQPNCFLFGSSMADSGLNPALIEKRLQLAGIDDLHCFNFAIEAFMAETSANYAEFLARRYRPRVIVFATSALEYDEKRDARRGVGVIPWLTYSAGQFSLEGWLVEHFYLYRYLLALPKYRDADYSGQRRLAEKLVAPDGFRRTKGATDKPASPFEVLITEYELNQPDFNGLKRMVALKETGTQVIVLEMPVHPEFMPHYLPDGERTYDRDFYQPVAQYLSETNTPFLRTWPEVSAQIPAKGWRNGWHLNADGAEYLSEWLAEQMLVLQRNQQISLSLP